MISVHSQLREKLKLKQKTKKNPLSNRKIDKELEKKFHRTQNPNQQQAYLKKKKVLNLTGNKENAN